MLNTLARMIRTGILTEPLPPRTNLEPRTSNLEPTQLSLWAILGRALCIRHVDAGSCNGCELEIQALNNPYYNLEGAGIKFVASPRHADLLLVTGPVSVNMEEALRRTYDAMPDPKLVIALGDCGTCGGIFSARGEMGPASYASRGPIANIIPVDHTIPGCPPTPHAILTGILQTLSTQ
jgi:Ni,Fe-hydrogenase III small subunit